MSVVFTLTFSNFLHFALHCELLLTYRITDRQNCHDPWRRPCLHFNFLKVWTLCTALWNLVDGQNYGPSKWSRSVIRSFYLSFLNLLNLVTTFWNLVHRLNHETWKLLRSVNTSVVFTLTFSNVGVQNSSTLIVLHGHLHSLWSESRTVNMAVIYYFFSSLSHSSCIINKHIKSYQIYLILVLVHWFKC